MAWSYVLSARTEGVNISMDGCMREMKSKVVNAGVKLRLNGEMWYVVTCLFADDTMLLDESEGDLQRVVNEFYSVCKRRKLKGRVRFRSVLPYLW